MAFPGGRQAHRPRPLPRTRGTAARQLTGLVTGTTNAGRPILQTPLGTLTLDLRAALPAGSRLLLELPPGALQSQAATTAKVAFASAGALTHAWPALEETVRVLQDLGGAAAANALAPQTLPQPGPQLASGLLFFLAALGAGEFNAWLGGPAAQALKGAGRGALLSRLERDFGQMSRFAESAGSEWRLFLLPLYDGGQLDQLRLFLRHRDRGQRQGGGDGDADSTRFVLEVELSRLGDLQLDGLVRRRRFDLMLRTRGPLPDVMCRDIVEIFHNANETAGYRGNIGFQSSADWQFIPIPETTDAASPGLVV